MANLYDIDNRLKALEEMGVDIETGEMLEGVEFDKLLDEIEMSLAEKIENTICFVKNLKSDVDAFKEEEKALATRRKTKEKLMLRLQDRVDRYIREQHTDEEGVVDVTTLNKYKMETPKMKLSYRKSETVEVEDMDALPKEFIKEKVEVSADKAGLKKALKLGEVSGAKLNLNVNMQVK